MPRRMRILTVLSSSNQLYSGIGRAVFAFSERLCDRVESHFAIDDVNPRNVGVLNEFAGRMGMPVHLGRGRKQPDALDNGNDDLRGVIVDGLWDAVECLCWANSDTNAKVLEAIGRTPLIYTPHHQPSWSVPMTAAQAIRTEAVHGEVLRRADLVLCDSPWERRELQSLSYGRVEARFLPLGCDFRDFTIGGTDRSRQLLFVGDLAEPRKRFDRVIAIVERLSRRWPDLRLRVVGNRSDEAASALPERLRAICSFAGYVTETELRAAYAESAGLILLSDFEAFGIPILEALACGTTVFLSRVGPTLSLFERFRGARFCPAEDLEATASIVDSVLGDIPTAIRETLADRRKLMAQFDWDHLAEAKWDALKGAWFSRQAWARTA